MNTQSDSSAFSALKGKEPDLECCDWYHVTSLSNFAKGYDKYKNQYSKGAIHQSTFPDQFFLLKKEELSIGIEKTQRLVNKLGLIDDRLIALKTRLPKSLLRRDHDSGVAQYIAQNHIDLAGLYFVKRQGSSASSTFIDLRVEDAMAQSMEVLGKTLLAWDSLTPRTISVLPIAMACQASCRFCFSKTSVSSEFKGRIGDWARIKSVLSQAKKAGAKRAVITGGGEPTLLESAQLHRLIEECSKSFDKVVLISNAYVLAKMTAHERLSTLQRWDNAGLSILAVSRHHNDNDKNAHIMGVDTQTELIAKTFNDNRDALAGMTLRLICVIQKDGVATLQDVEDYLSWAVEQGVRQVNFKELYVSTSNESAYSNLQANDYSAVNQVSLGIIHDFVEKYKWEQIATLDWGAPIYKGVFNDKKIQIAAYTEPSVYWERSNGIARSWNLMSDGKVLASLEDPKSNISLVS